MAKTIITRVHRNLARRLRDARREVGLSTRAVAEQLSRRIPVSHTTIAAYENGVTMPPINLLAALADLYGRTLDWLLDDRNTFSSVRLRNVASRAGVNERRQFEALAAKWSDAYKQLERHLDLTLRATLRTEVRADTDPKALAAMVRKHLELGEDRPVPNMVEVLEDACAIRVLEVKTPIAVDGLAAKHGDGNVVVLNPRTNGERQRLNTAMELAHVLYGSTGLAETVIEKRAFEFASYLLLPDHQLVQALDGKSFLRLIAFKEKFGISVAAMIHRAEELKLIKTTTSRWLWTEMIRRGWKASEPGHVWRDRAIRFETMLESSIHTRSLTWAGAESVTGVKEDELKQRLADVTSVNEPAEIETEEQAILRFPDPKSA